MLEHPGHDLEGKYAYLLKTMYIAIFYSPVVPIGVIISTIGYSFFYWMEKVQIL